MWRTATLSVILLAGSAAVLAQETKAFSGFARSQHYSMNIDVVPLAGGEYDARVTVTDLATNTVVATSHLGATSKMRAAMSESDAGDVHIRISVRPAGPVLTSSLEVTRGDMVIDSIAVTWSIKPHGRGVVGGVISMPYTQRPLPPDTYRVGGEVKAPVVIRRVEPAYTDEARKARISGIVIVETFIDKTGFVRDVQVLKPLPFGLDQAAVDAVKQWQFEPATRNGVPVDVAFDLTVNFKLDTGKQK